MDSLRHFAALNTFDVIILVATWLHPGIVDQELGFDNFTIFRNDSTRVLDDKIRGGGVLVAVRKDLHCRRLETPANADFEHILVDLTLSDTRTVIAAFYIPPHFSLSNYHEISNLLSQNLSTNAHDIIMAGVFNLPSTTWSRDEEMLSVLSEADSPRVRDAATVLCNVANDLCLQQHNTIPNSHGNILDLIFSTFNPAHVSVELDHHLRIDKFHPPLTFKLPILNRLQFLNRGA